MRPYQYRCHDHSLLTPPFKKWIVAPSLRFVPHAVPANMITVFSNAFVYAALYLACNPPILGSVATRLGIALCLLIYLIGDHLDGMQAKRTGTGSALGEFCDHYLDAFNNGIIVFTLLTVFNVSNPVVIGITLSASYLAHMAVFYEQFKTGWLTFEKMGSLEGVLFAMVLIAASTLPVVNNFLSYPLFSLLTIFEMLMLASATGAIVAFFTTWKRTPNVSPGYWLFASMLVTITVLAAYHLTGFELFVFVTLYASLYIGRIMQGHLIDGVERQTDLITPLFLLIAILIEFYQPYSFYFLTAYLVTAIAVLVVQVFSTLKIYWVWINPGR